MTLVLYMNQLTVLVATWSWSSWIYLFSFLNEGRRNKHLTIITGRFSIFFCWLLCGVFWDIGFATFQRSILVSEWWMIYVDILSIICQMMYPHCFEGRDSRPERFCLLVGKRLSNFARDLRPVGTTRLRGRSMQVLATVRSVNAAPGYRCKSVSLLLFRPHKVPPLVGSTFSFYEDQSFPLLTVGYS